MIDKPVFHVVDDPAIRARVLAAAADSQRASAVYPPGLRDEPTMWRLGSLCFWKAAACKQKQAAAPFPTYARGSLEMTLYPDMHLALERFTTTEGRPAFAIVLRSEKDPKGTFGTFILDESEAERIVALVSQDMNEARCLATDRYRAAGGDPAAVASQRAPSPAEMFRQLDGLFGDPDDTSS